MSLESELENAQPGDRIVVRGRQVAGKVQGVRGTASAWIELVGEDENACLIPEPGYPYAVARFEDCEYFRFGGFKVEGDGETERAVQLFRSEHIEIHDLETSGVTEDHIHTPGSSHVHIERCFMGGRGGEPMGGGKAGHAVYFTRVDGGGACEDLVAEDCDCANIAGAAFQANGDGARLSGVVFRRCRAVDYGWVGGSGVNLAFCDDPLLEDIILRPHTVNDNPGVASFDGTTGTIMRRYDIDCEDLSSGPMSAVAGVPAEPQPPNFDEETEPPPVEPEPTPEPEAGYQYCPSCGGGKTQLGPEGSLMPCATCTGSGVIPLPS